MKIPNAALDKFSREVAKPHKELVEAMRLFGDVATNFARAMASVNAELRDSAAARKTNRDAA
jgi:hypothetical protein